ncbi:MAG: 50S ribosomal protein L4 [Planctomycetes bacterium]|nr:50S ribosomal protein L4 [Planctomycetota bacterium]
MIEVDEARLGGRVRKGLLREAILMFEINQHIGTSATKTRTTVSGSNRKPWRQKGTGRARAGHKRSPIWRGGGIVHGPQPRDRSYRIPRAERRLALRNAVLAKCQEGEVLLVERLELAEAKTVRMVEILDHLQMFETALIVPHPFDRSVWQAARNIPGVQVRSVENVNAFDLLVAKQVLMTRSAFTKFLDEGFRPARRARRAVGETAGDASPCEPAKAAETLPVSSGGESGASTPPATPGSLPVSSGGESGASTPPATPGSSPPAAEGESSGGGGESSGPAAPSGEQPS